MNIKLKGCPFCGNQPAINRMGTCIDLECCAFMSIQKCDVLTLEERETWDNNTCLYGDDEELKALKVIADDWNKRDFDPKRDPVHINIKIDHS